jgi:cbb3-type cytochrome oxidase subunit 3
VKTTIKEIKIMHKEVLSSIDGVSLFPVIAILVFFVFFIALLIYVIRMDKTKIDEMASLPINDRLSATNLSQISLNGKSE